MRFNKYKRAFDIFADTTAVVSVKENYNDYTGEYTLREIGTLTGDMQPYSGGLAESEYGLKLECQKRFFCRQSLPVDYTYGVKLGSDVAIGSELTSEAPDKADMYIRDGDRYFQIVYIGEYSAGPVLLLKEVDNID